MHLLHQYARALNSDDCRVVQMFFVGEPKSLAPVLFCRLFTGSIWTPWELFLLENGKWQIQMRNWWRRRWKEMFGSASNDYIPFLVFGASARAKYWKCWCLSGRSEVHAGTDSTCTYHWLVRVNTLWTTL